MRIAKTRDQLDQALSRLAADQRPLSLVPTMGALHDGHLDLVGAASAGGGAVAVSIFVNPLQFDAGADLARYPKDHARDVELLEAAGCDLVWIPDVETMYPASHATVIDVAGPALGFEGAFRKGHFRGVATVVAMLFGQLRPRTAWFGEKDWQQLQVVRRMTADLALGVDIRAVATRREADGLAMSSRNRFLDSRERQIAPLLHAALRNAAGRLRAGAEDAGRVLAEARAGLDQAGFKTEYFALVEGESLAPLERPQPGSRLLAAARLGSVRLLDNVDAG